MQEVWRCEVDHVSNYKSSSPKNIRYGKLQGLSKREEMTIISIIENTIERTGEIENICGREHSFNSIPAEQPVKTLSDIYQAASILREAWKIGSAAITNVINLLESNGVITAEIDALDPFISQHAILDDTIPVIAINSNMDTENFRFAALKELAHVPNTIIITSVGIDQNSGGTFVSGLHSYQGQYIPFRGERPIPMYSSTL